MQSTRSRQCRKKRHPRRRARLTTLEERDARTIHVAIRSQNILHRSAMPIRHIVEQGDTIVALAERHGLFARTLWEHPQNAALRDLRARMDVLLPGDEVYIPDRRDKVVA